MLAQRHVGSWSFRKQPAGLVARMPCILTGPQHYTRAHARRPQWSGSSYGEDDFPDPDRRPAQQRRSRAAWGFQSDNARVQLQLNGTEINVARENLWQLAIPAAMLLGLATIIGPLVVGIVMAAVATGAALSFGAVALSLIWIPFVLLFGFMALSMVGVSFGFFATFGLGLFLPKLLSLGIATGGMGLGWLVVKSLLPASATGSQQQQQPLSGAASPADASVGSETDVSEEEARRMSGELREFDSLLAEREEARRLAEWRRRRS
ncbi:hypothetical protein QJQ45_004289 [Haematococcus lacustris]|nr:hypothetical protein QJQ45_004289 [Haematococcus lacustris]